MIKAYWNGLSLQEKNALRFLGFFIFLYILIDYIILPSFNAVDSANKEWQSWQENAQYVLQHKQQLVKISQQQKTTQHLVSLTQKRQQIIKRAEALKLTIQRVEPAEEQLTVWFNNVPFNASMSWLQQLTQQDMLVIKSLSVDRQQSGKVNIRVVLY
ncbi:type II secretion system protein GspM [Zooshikella ganghwensis]|uniref:Type II secretion system protein M n=1 Tax=Zooshikella ganghwensis TaxID=202772 RepID=A0A4P9VPV9_9GAMM|nr:type II secretion system protein GspM [Zooshikella ganghwensis]RDH44092.1 type II secretion system protein M [Zooshikella ganghwensis]